MLQILSAYITPNSGSQICSATRISKTLAQSFWLCESRKDSWNNYFLQTFLS